MASRATIQGSLQNEKGIWVVRARVYDLVDEQTHNRSKSTGLRVKDNTKRAAEAKMREIVAEWEAEANETPCRMPRSGFQSEHVLFEDYVEAWLANRELSVRPNSAKSYRDYANTHIIPELGGYHVEQITWRVLQKFCDSKLKDHSKSSVKKYFIVIRGAMDDAVRDGVIPSNPERLVRWPKGSPSKKARALSFDEVAKLMTAVEDAGEPIRAAVVLALFYGLRRSEACGLRWTDIDFANGTMHIQHTLVQNGSVVLDDDHTKTAESDRTLVLIEDTVPYLKQLRGQQRRAGLVMDKVVVWPDGRPVRPDGITRMFHTVLRRSGIENARFHDLRHTAASMLANAGVPPKQLQAFLGHSDIEMTLGVYVHTPDDAAKATSEAMTALARQKIFPRFCSDFGSDSQEMEVQKIEFA